MSRILTAKAMAKIINDENNIENLVSYCEREANSFFERTLEYLQSHHKPYQSKFLKQTKCMKPEKIIDAISKIFSIQPEKHQAQILEKLTLEVVARCFAYFLHPETPEFIRTPCLQVYINILKQTKPENLYRMSEANVNLIPFNRFARTKNEHDLFKEKFNSEKNTEKDPENKVIIILNRTPGNKDDCLQNLEKTYQMVNEQWIRYQDTKDLQHYCDFLIKYIIGVIYKQITLDAGYEKPKFGFENPVIEEFHVLTLKFLNDFYDTEPDLRPLFKDEILMKIFIHILEETKGFDRVENVLATLSFCTKVMKDSKLSKHLMNVNRELFLSIPITAGEISSKYFDESRLEPNSEQVKSTREFFIETYKMMFSLLGEDDVYLELEKIFMHFQNDHRIAAYIYASYVHHLICIKEPKPKAWNFLKDISISSNVFSAMSCKYAQMVAVMQIPALLELPIEEVITCCSTFYLDRVKGVTPEQFDFFIENVDHIFDKPNLIVMDKLGSMWSPLDSFDLKLKGIPLPVPPISKFSDEDYAFISTQFISPFDCYATQEDNEAKRRLFAPILTYYCTLQKLSIIPPFQSPISYNIPALFSFSKKRLFTSILNETDSLIVGRSAQVVNLMLNQSDIIDKVDPESLTCWYSAIILLLCRVENNLKSIGVDSLSTAIRLSSTGSTCLLPTLISLLEEEELDISYEIMNILSSIPLFEVDHFLPETIISYVSNKFLKKYPSLFITKSQAIINKRGVDLRTRLTKLISLIFDKARSNHASWDIVLTIVPSFLSNELCRPKPDPKIIEYVLNAVVDSINSQNEYAIDLVRAELMVFPKIVEVAPQVIKNFINSAVRIITQSTTYSSNWLIGLIEIITVLFINNYILMKDDQSYPLFVEYLGKISSPKKSSQLASCVEDAPKFALSMYKMLSTYFGAFPFHNGIMYPTSKGSITNEENVISTRSGYVLKMRSSEEESTISSFTPVGQFIWNFQSCDHEFFKNSPSELATLPLINHNPPNQFKNQTELNSSLESLINGIESNFKELPSVTSQDINDSEYIEYAEKFKSRNIKEYATHSPSCQMENIKAGIVSSLGLFRPSHQHDIREIAADQYQINLHKLATTNHRYLQKMGVLYLGKETNKFSTILGTQIEETSSQFRDFIHGLGWPSDTMNHVGFDGSLEIPGEQTGKTIIYYADFLREIVFHIPSLFTKDLADQNHSNRLHFISNDNIVIVWNESEYPFDPTLIYQKMNNLFIVLTPKPTSIIQVQFISRSEIPFHNRDYSYVFITKNMVPSFIREISILAQDQFDRMDDSWEHPVITLSNLVNEIDSNATNKSSKEYTSIANLMCNRSKPGNAVE